MKTNLIVLVLVVALSACGKNKGETQNDGNTVEATTNQTSGTTGEVTPPIAEETIPPAFEEEKECFLVDLESELPKNCKSIFYGKELIAGSSNDEEGITLIASKRNGGEKGSKWFDASLILADSRELFLPAELTVSGNGGNGQKVYILINGEIDCVWMSHGSKKYQKPRCMVNATRNASDASGFSGGSEVPLEKVFTIKSLQMTVNGAQGNGVLTTVTAKFLKKDEKYEEEVKNKKKEENKEKLEDEKYKEEMKHEEEESKKKGENKHIEKENREHSKKEKHQKKRRSSGKN